MIIIMMLIMLIYIIRSSKKSTLFRLVLPVSRRPLSRRPLRDSGDDAHQLLDASRVDESDWPTSRRVDVFCSLHT